METENLKDNRKDKADAFQAMWVQWLEDFEYEDDSSEVATPQIVNNKESFMHVYPNPVLRQLNIDIYPDKASQIHIFDTSGSLVFALSAPENTVDVSDNGEWSYLPTESFQTIASYLIFAIPLEIYVHE